MKQCSVALVFFCLLVALMSVTAAAYDFPPLSANIVYGTAPDARVKSWIRLNVLGDRDHPLPIIWLSPEEFGREYPEMLVMLPRDEYKVFTTFVRSNQCPTIQNKYSGRGTLQATEYFDGRQQVRCIMPREQACGYLSKMVALPEVKWTDTKQEPFRRLINSLECKKG